MIAASAMSNRPGITIVVNERGSNGHDVMLRRARTFQRLLEPAFRVELIAAPKRPTLADLRRSDLVYVVDPGRRGFPSAVAAWVVGRPVIVEMGDPQAPLYRAGGRGRASVLAGGTIDWIVARRARGVVVRGKGLAGVLSLRVPWIEIPDGVDTDLFVPGADGDLRSRLGLPEDALVVGLTGSLRGSSPYGWDLVEALSLLRDRPVHGLVVGDGDGLENLRRRAAKLAVSDRLVLTGQVPHGDIPRYVSAMDVCLSRQTNDAVGRSRTTAKLPEYLACDRYVLATAVGGAAEILPEEMLLPYEGSSDPNHVDRLAGRIAELVPRRAELRRGAGTRRIALERFSYPALAERLAAFLEGFVP
jgi:glycosyltransferase involved in cell wall biosynthesis